MRKEDGTMTKWIDIMSGHELQMLHDNSLRILAEIGIKVPHGEILRRCREFGADVDFSAQVVRMPAAVMEDFILKNRRESFFDYDGIRSPQLTGGGISTQTYLFDYVTNTRRLGVMDDLYKGIRLLDGLENFGGSAAVVIPSDIPDNMTDIESMAAIYTYSRKEGQTYILSPESAEYILEMAKVAGRSVGYLLETVSPLQFRKESLDIALKMADKGCALWMGPMVIGGASGPMTIAGNASLQNAEILGSMYIAGAMTGTYGLGYGGGNHTMDMRTMLCSFGSPNQALLGMAMGQLGRYYKLWSVSNSGLSDSFLQDFQYGTEKATSTAFSLLSGCGGTGCHGIVGADQGASFEQIVLDNEYISYFNFIADGLHSFEVNEDTLAFDVLEEVGTGGSFIAEEHTVDNLAKNYFRSDIFSRVSYDSWIAGDRSTALQKAHEKAEALTEGYRDMEPVLPASQVEDLDRIRREARAAMNALQ
ncbi:MAG: trimethylamine methyltransferase family protein [Saccharofermentanales bacterium]